MEDITPEGGATAQATAEADSSYKEILAGQGTEPSNPDPNSEVTPNLDAQKTAAPDPNEPLIFEIDGKDVTLTRSQIEKLQKIGELETSIADQKKQMDRDYTHKSQANAEIRKSNAEFRKSLETSFGRIPEPQELKALGKVWQSYFADPNVRQAIDSILEGNFQGFEAGKSGEPKGTKDAYTLQLEQKIHALESRLEDFVGTSEEREQTKSLEEARQIWDSWVSKQTEKGIKITEEIDRAMGPFVRALREANPGWDKHKILDEAYRHANIENLNQNARNEVLKTADQAKKGSVPKIKPKVAAKADSEMSYAEIIRSAI